MLESRFWFHLNWFLPVPVHPCPTFKEPESKVRETKSIPEASSTNSAPLQLLQLFTHLPSPLVWSLTIGYYHDNQQLPGRAASTAAGVGLWGRGRERRSQRRCLLQVPGCFWAHPILREGGGPSGDAGAAAAWTADTLVGLEGWFLFAHRQPETEGEKKSQQPLLMLGSEAASDSVTRKMDSVCTSPSFHQLLKVSAWWVRPSGAIFLVQFVPKCPVHTSVACTGTMTPLEWEM